MDKDPIKKLLAYENTECALHNRSTDLCAPGHIINSYEEFLENYGGKKTIYSGKKTKTSTNTDTKTNKKNGDIDNQSIWDDDSKSKKDKILIAMNDALDCNSEVCILKSKQFRSFLKEKGNIDVDEIISNNFKPAGPSKDDGWLSNKHIDTILDHLALKYPHRHYVHIPFQMRDFNDDSRSELKNFSFIDAICGGMKTFGVVFNTDWSYGNGIHWYSIFGELYDKGSHPTIKSDKKILEIEYFNSSGEKPLPETQDWINEVKNTIQHETSNTGDPIEVIKHYSTGYVFQEDNHSCGVYSLAYQWLRLEEVPARWFHPTNFNDSIMKKIRKVLFLQS